MSTSSLLIAGTSLEAIQGSSYFLIFILMCIEGPLITYLTSFAASLRIFNIYIIFGLSVAGSVIGDFIYYYIGHVGKNKITEKYLKKQKVKSKTIDRIEYGLKNHTGKTMALIKLIPPLPAVGLVMAGAIKVPVKKFFTFSVLISILYSLFFLVLGFYTGEAYLTVAKYFKRVEIAALVILVIVVFGGVILEKVIERIKRSQKLI